MIIPNLTDYFSILSLQPLQLARPVGA